MVRVEAHHWLTPPPDQQSGFFQKVFTRSKSAEWSNHKQTVHRVLLSVDSHITTPLLQASVLRTLDMRIPILDRADLLQLANGKNKLTLGPNHGVGLGVFSSMKHVLFPTPLATSFNILCKRVEFLNSAAQDWHANCMTAVITFWRQFAQK